MRYDCILLDFDGTFTDVEREGAPFVEAYRADLAGVLGVDNVDEAWREAEARVHAHPADFGWHHGDRIVAPADADPYIRATAVAQILMDERGAFMDGDARSEELQALYARNYLASATVFRPEAREVLERLLASDAFVCVVTNSRTDAVSKKLDRLAPAGRNALDVRGDAKKFVVAEPAHVDAVFAALPETEQVPGLSRPLFLRRGYYYETLRDIWKGSGTSAAATLVVGDIYELDLALPARLGCAIHLVTRATTPAYERSAVDAHSEGATSDSLDGVLARVDA